MAENKAKKRRAASEPRRTDFSVKGQLIGKLGPRGYGRLLERLRKEAQ